jgi:pyruvate formate lyase activating enzyme
VTENLGPDVPLHFTAFHPDFRLLDRPPTPPETLRRARRIALENGLRYAYVGNVHDAASDSTFCHGCGALLIGRDWYERTHWGWTPRAAAGPAARPAQASSRPPRAAGARGGRRCALCGPDRADRPAAG